MEFAVKVLHLPWNYWLKTYCESKFQASKKLFWLHIIKSKVLFKRPLCACNSPWSYDFQTHCTICVATNWPHLLCGTSYSVLKRWMKCANLTAVRPCTPHTSIMETVNWPGVTMAVWLVCTELQKYNGNLTLTWQSYNDNLVLTWLHYNVQDADSSSWPALHVMALVQLCNYLLILYYVWARGGGYIH